jgi:hypothetical protein
LKAIDQMGFSTAGRSQVKNAIIPKDNREYYEIQDADANAAKLQELTTTYQDALIRQLGPELASKFLNGEGQIRISALTPPGSTKTSLLPSFFSLKSEAEQAAILFHEALWVLQKDASYDDVMAAENAVQNYIEGGFPIYDPDLIRALKKFPALDLGLMPLVAAARQDRMHHHPIPTLVDIFGVEFFEIMAKNPVSRAPYHAPHISSRGGLEYDWLNLVGITFSTQEPTLAADLRLALKTHLMEQIVKHDDEFIWTELFELSDRLEVTLMLDNSQFPIVGLKPNALVATQDLIQLKTLPVDFTYVDGVNPNLFPEVAPLKNFGVFSGLRSFFRIPVQNINRDNPGYVQAVTINMPSRYDLFDPQAKGGLEKLLEFKDHCVYSVYLFFSPQN